jgi:acyl carrier protein
VTVEIADKLRTYFVEELDLEVPKEELHDAFVLANRIDSMGVFDLISFIETEFGVEVSNEELVPQHFGTVGGVVRFVESKTAS